MDEKRRKINAVVLFDFFFFVGFQRIIYLLWGKQLVSEVCGFQTWVHGQDFWKFRKDNGKEDAVRERYRIAVHISLLSGFLSFCLLKAAGCCNSTQN